MVTQPNRGVSYEGNFNAAELHFECFFQGYPFCLFFFRVKWGSPVLPLEEDLVILRQLFRQKKVLIAKFENCIFKDNTTVYVCKLLYIVTIYA